MKQLLSITLLFTLFAVTSTNGLAQEQQAVTNAQKMEEMIDDVEDIEKKLARCYSEVCQEVRENSDVRTQQFTKAKKAFQNDNLEDAMIAVKTAHSILSTDVELLETEKSDELTREIWMLESELEERVSSFISSMEG
jgi:flagellin-specific chaperone FliS